MKPSWVLVCCVACFLIGCNVGEKRVKSKIRAAFQKAGEEVNGAALLLDSKSIQPHVRPTRGTSAEDMREVLNRKDREFESRQATNR
jgi:hypothetical protein